MDGRRADSYIKDQLRGAGGGPQIDRQGTEGLEEEENTN